MIGLEVTACGAAEVIDEITGRLRDLVAMGPLYSRGGTGGELTDVDRELIRCGFAQVWDVDLDGWQSVTDTDLGRELVCSR